MRVLVTGHKGFVGSHLMRVLPNAVGWDIQGGKDIFSEDFERAVKKADAIIHLAALTQVNESFRKPADYFRVNVLGTARVCELSVRYQKKLVYPSSAAVYHPELSPYAASKALAEKICQALATSYPITILRFFNIYGPGMNENTGSLMYEFVKGLKTGKLIVFGDGEQTRDFINIHDIVSIIKESLKSSWSGKVVDCGTGRASSVNYVGGLFAHYGDVKIDYQPPRREIKWSIANTQTLRMLYRKPLKTNLEKDIKELVEYYKAP